MRGLYPLAGALHFFDFALHQITLQGADVRVVELAVEMIGLVEERARQQIFASHFELFTLHVLRADSDALAAAHLFAEARDAQASLFAGLTAFRLEDLGID